MKKRKKSITLRQLKALERRHYDAVWFRGFIVGLLNGFAAAILFSLISEHIGG